MKIVTYGMEYIVTNDRGEEIKAALFSKNPPNWVDLNGDTVRATSITAFRRGGYTAVDKPAIEAADKNRLDRKNRKLLE